MELPEQMKKEEEWKERRLWREKTRREKMQRARPSWADASSTAPSPRHLPPFRGSGGSDYSGGWVQRCWRWRRSTSRVCGGDLAMRRIPP